jgi:Mg-chelatase subunit ChlD
MDRAIIKTDRGFKITKKEASNISISNNAVHIQRKGKPIEKRYNTGSVYLLIDCSGSMLDGNKMNQAKDGARKFLRDSISKGYSAGLIKFDNYTQTIMEPQKQVSLPQKKIYQLLLTLQIFPKELNLLLIY